MARLRVIKAETWSDEKFVELSMPARLLFIGTWNFADDSGVLEYSTARLKMEIFPNDAIDVGPLLDELLALGMLSAYTVGDQKLLLITHFSRHQHINRPSKPRFPLPTNGNVSLTEHSRSTHGERNEDSVTIHGALTEHSLTDRETEEETETETETEEKKTSGAINGSGPCARDTVANVTPPTLPLEEKKQQNLRAGEIAALLREAGIEGCHARDDEIADWSRDPGVTNELLLVAVDKAKKNGAHRPGTRYLRPIVEDLRHPKPARVGGDWSGSDAGIERRARELGIVARPGESYPQLAERIRSKAAA